MEHLTEVNNQNNQEIINKVIITGHVGKDPTLDTVGGSQKLAKFSIATNQDYTNNKGVLVKNTLWHNIIAWGKVAEEAAQHLKKGTKVTVEGKLNYSQYTDKNGVKKIWTDIVIHELKNYPKKEAV